MKQGKTQRRELRQRLDAAQKRIRFYLKAQTALMALCWLFIVLSAAAYMLGQGFGPTVALGVCSAFCAVTSWLPRWLSRPTQALADQLALDLEECVSDPPAAPDAIPLTIGFANLAEEEFQRHAQADAEALAPLFAHSHLVPEYMMMPQADALFLYAHLNEDGTVQAPAHFGVRQLEELSKAKLIVLASANTPESVKNAALLPGPKSADIVFTLNRNGAAFAHFFAALFSRMKTGQELMAAWTELAPKDPLEIDPDAPQAILLAEAGEVRFPCGPAAQGV